MALLCPTNCGDPGAIAARYDDCSEDVTREYGFNHFILVKCDYEFTDILDPTEWGAAVTAGDILISPAGTLTIAAPTQDTIEAEGCGRTIPGKLTYQVDFYTYQVAADLSDWAYWNDFFNYYPGWRIMFLDCNGFFYIDNAWPGVIGLGSPATIAGETPGMEFSVTQPPRWEAGDGRLGRWAVQFEIKTKKIMGVAALPGVPAVL